MLRAEAAADLTRFIEEQASGFPAVQWVWRALRARGKLLASEVGFAWGLLPLLACEEVGGDSHSALPLSVALECFMAAADTFDDIEDADDANALWLQCGISTATNVGVFLLCLSQVAISQLRDRGVPVQKVADIARAFASSGAIACVGQQSDSDYAASQRIDETQYLDIVAQKSGSLVECACRTGALIGTDDVSAVDALGAFGRNVGIALQIGNDTAGVSTESDRRNDLRTGKRTLPIIFALDSAPAPVRQEIEGILWLGRAQELLPEEIDRVRSLLVLSGSLMYATLIADVYWERALGCLKAVGSPPDSPLARWVRETRDA